MCEDKQCHEECNVTEPEVQHRGGENYTMKATKSRRMRWAIYVACKNSWQYLEDLGIDIRITLK
jgi:hypothetical protein